SCVATFMMRWLIPRLYDFNALHRAIEIRLSAMDAPIDFARNGIDIAIRRGKPPWPRNVVVSPFLADRVALQWPTDLACVCDRFSRSGQRRNATSGADSGFNKTEIDLMCPGMAGREAEMQRRALALAVTATLLCCGSATRAQAEFAACQPLPPWYPRGWE